MPTNFGWSYPPGVSGNEYEISGADYEKELDITCEGCGGVDCMYEEGYRGNRWATCSICGFSFDYEDIGDTDPRLL